VKGLLVICYELKVLRQSLSAEGYQSIGGNRCHLFHTLFIVAPEAGKALFGNAQIGEYFRVFVTYGVIALSLAMHTWKRAKKVDELLLPASASAPTNGVAD
jgi:hypothetical protein